MLTSIIVIYNMFINHEALIVLVEDRGNHIFLFTHHFIGFWQSIY